MASIDRFILSVKRAETPFFKFLKRLGTSLIYFTVPVPRWSRPIFTGILAIHSGVMGAFRWIIATFYYSPAFRSCCTSVGQRLSLERVPAIGGNVSITIGNDVMISGCISIAGARIFEKPEFVVGNKVFIGHNCSFVVGRRIEIGNEVYIAGGVHVADFDGHPLDPVERAAGVQVSPDRVKPVRIGNRAWVGRNSTILKGVTIGEAAIVGASSVVRADVPPYTIVSGNPAVVVKVLQQPLP